MLIDCENSKGFHSSRPAIVFRAFTKHELIIQTSLLSSGKGLNSGSIDDQHIPIDQMLSNFINSSSFGERIISVLRFLALPSKVSLPAFGKYSPFPEAVIRVGAIL